MKYQLRYGMRKNPLPGLYDGESEKNDRAGGNSLLPDLLTADRCPGYLARQFSRDLDLKYSMKSSLVSSGFSSTRRDATSSPVI